MNNGKKLYRSRKNRIFAGMAGGLANYFGFDSTIIRLILLLLLFVGGFPILLFYLISILFIPPEPAGAEAGIDEKEREWLFQRRSIIRTLAIVVLVIAMVSAIFFAGSLAGSLFPRWGGWGWNWRPSPTPNF